MAKELAAKSVNARRKKAQEAKQAAEIRAPKNSGELVNELAKVFAELRCGGLNVAVARTMASVATVILKGWEQTSIREELEQLRQMIVERNTPTERDTTTLLFKETK